MQNQHKATRYNPFHNPKRQVVGPAHVPPAWKTNGMAAGPSKGREPVESGSRIFISKLPIDVGEKEVEELFRKTIGPLKESFLVYNSQGRSKGMAIVTFQRPGDAAIAQAKYDGRVVDGRRAIKIELMVDKSSVPLSGPPPTLTLLNRLAPAPTPPNGVAPSTSTPTAPRVPARPQTQRSVPIVKPAAIPPRRIKQKKGPKRLKKREAVTVADLDKEMEDYRAAAPDV
ncbi:hypothetical protein NLJ89_g5334 [Agrocybe chaxingu]|uniref:RRM domain-containing protein n=1 Tax=Agrocybe chaxingu TaxID=84603 RepID=A0A9W8K0T5_9AGAR|nr:hypothetical protein NLJ89_g5334 [Agrocybe chaxingu]